MAILIVGLLLFLGAHSSRMVANEWRRSQIARHGETRWKLTYTAVSVIGLVLVVIGYGQARIDPMWLWYPPFWARHAALLLTIPAFILLVAAYVPANGIRARLGHPMLAGVKVWAVSHLLANGTLADLLLFGSFLVWSIAGFAILRRRDRAAGITPPPGSLKGTLITVVLGTLFWYVFAVYLHVQLMGVNPLP